MTSRFLKKESPFCMTPDFLVIKALEPEGRYFFPYALLKPYIKAEGPLAQFIHQGLE